MATTLVSRLSSCFGEIDFKRKKFRENKIDNKKTNGNTNSRRQSPESIKSIELIKTDKTTQDDSDTKQNIINLHDNIKAENIESVRSFIQRFTFDQYAFNDAGRSAVAISLEVFNLDIYELLVTNGFRLGTLENIKNIVKIKSKQKQIFDFHRNCAIESEKEHLTALRSKCRLHVNTAKNKKQEKFQAIMNALEKLDQTAEEISSLLKVLALCPELKIIFDFNRKSIDEIDPSETEQTEGSCYYKMFCITIGAKNLLNRKKSSKVLGTMAHEFCHLAMNLMFNNRCNPYEESDENKKNKFKKIVDDYKKRFDLNKIGEKIVELVYGCYRENIWHAELIVRVPHMLAHYKKNEVKLKQVREDFSDLFEFYHDVMSKTEQIVNEMKVKLAIKEINKISGISLDLQTSKCNLKNDVIDKFDIDLASNIPQVYKSNNVDVTIKTIYEIGKKVQKTEYMIFAKIENFDDEEKAKLIFKTLESFENVNLIVSCNKIDKSKLKVVEKIYENVTKNKKIVFVSNENPEIATVEFQEVNHLWSELTEELPKKLLTNEVNFQGKSLKLNEIWSKNLESNKFVPLDELSRNEEIKIGEDTKFEEFHVERKFVQADAKWDRSNERYDKEPVAVDEIITEVVNSKVFVLSDAPGNGKSTEFKLLTSKLKEKFKNYWIILIDLKMHTKNLKNKSDDSMDFSSVQNIANFLAVKILKLQKFEKEIFSELFKTDRVVVLMDGVDEISPRYENFVMKLVDGIRKTTENQLWMSTRPHLAKELEEKLKTKAWKLTRFSKKDQESFFEQIFKKKNLKYEKFRELIEIILNAIETKRNFWDDNKATNPLLLFMIAELSIEYQSAQLQDLNLYKIYDKFVKKMFSKLLTKGSQLEEDSVKLKRNAKIQEFHRKIAFKIAIETKIKIKKHKKLTYSFKNLSKPSDDQLARIGLMYNDGSDRFYFIHETFSEFFVAQTIVEKIFELKFQTKEDLEKILDVLFVSMSYDFYYMIMKFLDDALENIDIDRTSDESKILLESMNQIKSNQNRDSYIHNRLNFTEAAKKGCNNLIISLSEFVGDNQKVMEIWMERCYRNRSMLSTAFEFQSLENIEELWSFAEKFFTRNQIKKPFTYDNRLYINSFAAAISNDDESVFQFFLQLIEKKLKSSERKKLINYKSLDLPYICKHKNFNLVLNRIKGCLAPQYKDFLRASKGRLFKDVCENQNNASVKFLYEEITENFGSNELRFVLQITEKDDRNVLMRAVKNKENSEVFETLINLIKDENKVREMLQEEDKNGENALMHSFWFGTIENIREVLKTYEKYFNTNELKEILMKANNKDKNVLDVAASHNFKTFHVLWVFMKELFKDEVPNSMLMKSLEQIDIGHLSDFIPFIFQTLTSDDYQIVFSNFFEAAEGLYPDEFKKLFASNDSQGENADLFHKELFEFQDKNGETIIDWAKKNKNTEVLEIVNEKKNFFQNNINVDVKT